jgi:hypothetical protein
MGKTYRHNPEEQDYGFQDHRIDRKDMRRIDFAMATALQIELPIVKLPEAVKPSYVPSRDEEDMWYLRDRRLDIIQTLGEAMLHSRVRYY